MVITCSSCLTKFHLDDSRLPAKGSKVRCSRCQHIFFVPPPHETKEEVFEDLQTFAKFHEEMMEPGEKKAGVPPKGKGEKKIMPPDEEEEAFLFSEKSLPEPMERVGAAIPEERRPKAKPFKPQVAVRRERRRSSLFFIFVLVLLLMVFGAFYLWVELGSGTKLSNYLEYSTDKIMGLWKQFLGTEKEGLTIGDLNVYEEKIGEISLFIIEGKVNNQSRFIKKHIKIKVVVFNQNKIKVAEKETFCGAILTLEELRNQSPDFFKREIVIQPETEKERIIPSDHSVPFMVAFKNLSSEKKEFKVEIIEAPNL